MKYFEVKQPNGDGLCSDNSCPCGYPGAFIPRGEGYLFISQEVMNMRKDALTQKDLENKIALARRNFEVKFGTKSVFLFSSGVTTPTLMCEQGAKKRTLDLEIASKDAAYWWEMGLVPLRATPTIALNTKIYYGASIEDAKAKVFQEIDQEMIYSIEEVNTKETIIEVADKDIDEAIEKSDAKLPKNAFDIRREIVSEYEGVSRFVCK